MIENIIKDYGLYIIIAETAIIMALIALFLWHLFSDNNSELIDNLENDKKDLKKQLAIKDKSLSNYVCALNTANSNLKQWNEWYELHKYLLIRQEPQSNVIEFNLSNENKPQTSPCQVQYQYLQEANGGKFLKLFPTLGKCFFRTWKEGDVRKFEFCGNVSKALANINAIFDDVCEIEGKRSGAKEIENVFAGTLDSDLRIINKAKIRLK